MKIGSLAAPTKEISLSEIHDHTSAEQMLRRMALEINRWMRQQVEAGLPKEMRHWRFMAATPDHSLVLVQNIRAIGHSTVRIVGQALDGAPYMLLAHQSSMQLFVKFVADDQPEPEAGFQTMVGDVKIDPSSPM
jgi:hypothetical protein